MIWFTVNSEFMEKNVSSCTTNIWEIFDHGSLLQNIFWYLPNWTSMVLHTSGLLKFSLADIKKYSLQEYLWSTIYHVLVVQLEIYYCQVSNENVQLVFCYQNCSDLLWEKIVLVFEKNLTFISVTKFSLEKQQESIYWKAKRFFFVESSKLILDQKS